MTESTAAAPGAASLPNPALIMKLALAYRASMALFAAAELDLPSEANLYAVAYRPVRRQDRPEIDLWMATFALGGTLPLLPLRLTGDLFVPVDFEATYQEACRRRRLA